LSRQCQEAQRRATGKPQEKRVFIVGATPGIMEIKKYIGVLACSDSPVLISGEPGVEKIPVAKAIHTRGPRGAEPFTVVECRNTAPSLIETQIFANKPATSQREQTPETDIKCRGTLFLNDIDCLPVVIQHKLLNALRKQAERIGKAGAKASQDVRILSGSASKLNVLISE
jgi:DNA-binding NtrC family response regulator